MHHCTTQLEEQVYGTTYILKRLSLMHSLTYPAFNRVLVMLFRVEHGCSWSHVLTIVINMTQTSNPKPYNLNLFTNNFYVHLACISRNDALYLLSKA